MKDYLKGIKKKDTIAGIKGEANFSKLGLLSSMPCQSEKSKSDIIEFGKIFNE